MRVDVDLLYSGFCAGLPSSLRARARQLPFELKLAPDPEIPWSAVFKNRVTLEAPALLAEALPNASDDGVRAAVLAHLMAIVEAFAVDRIADGQIPDSFALRVLLDRLRSARDAALEALAGTDAVVLARVADRETLVAISAEQRLFARGGPVSFSTYERISAGKQAVGLPAATALAEAARAGEAERSGIRQMLLDVWLGLQFQDDVADWEEDADKKGAWAILLALEATNPPEVVTLSTERVRALVRTSGVLATMLNAAAARFAGARARAERLGAAELAAWLREREAEAAENALGEARSPGYMDRKRRLAPWAREVLG